MAARVRRWAELPVGALLKFHAARRGREPALDAHVQLPHGVARESIGLSTAGGSLTLDDGVQVVKDGGGFASVSSVGATSRTTLGVSAFVQDAYSEPLRIDLRNNAHVYGVLKTAADLTKQAGAGVDGPVSQNTSLKPLDLISWTVSLPNLKRGTCSLEPDKVQTIDPGSYGDIAVKRNCPVAASIASGAIYCRHYSHH